MNKDEEETLLRKVNELQHAVAHLFLAIQEVGGMAVDFSVATANLATGQSNTKDAIDRLRLSARNVDKALDDARKWIWGGADGAEN